MDNLINDCKQALTMRVFRGKYTCNCDKGRNTEPDPDGYLYTSKMLGGNCTLVVQLMSDNEVDCTLHPAQTCELWGIFRRFERRPMRRKLYLVLEPEQH
jgi:hypothetical protein